MITLNWLTYSAERSSSPVWATILSHWIVLLPILTTTAAFPLFNATLAANLEECLPIGSHLRRRPVAGPLCALPPLLLCAAVRDTSLIFSLAGLSGFVMVFFMPSLLLHASRRVCVHRFGAEGECAPSTTRFSGDRTIGVVLLLGSAAFIFSLWRLVVSLAS